MKTYCIHLSLTYFTNHNTLLVHSWFYKGRISLSWQSSIPLCVCVCVCVCVYSRAFARVCVFTYTYYIFFLSFYGGSQTKSWIWAVAPSLHHSHSLTGCKTHLRPTSQPTATPAPYPLSKPGIKLGILMVLVEFSNSCSMTGTPTSFFFFIILL